MKDRLTPLTIPSRKGRLAIVTGAQVVSHEFPAPHGGSEVTTSPGTCASSMR